MSTDKTFRQIITQQIEKLEHQIDQQHQVLEQHEQAVKALTNDLAYLWRQRRILIERVQTIDTSNDQRNGMHTVETLRV